MQILTQECAVKNENGSDKLRVFAPEQKKGAL